MKKLIFLFFLFLIPSVVFAKEDRIYTISIDSNFLEKYRNGEYTDHIDKMYQDSNLSIRDYLLMDTLSLWDEPYRNLFSVENQITYSIQSDVSVVLLKDYDYIQIKESSKKKNYNMLNYISVDDLLDCSIYHFYLFQQSLDSSSVLDFLNDDVVGIYGKIRSKNSLQTLLTMTVINGILEFHVPDNVMVSDNTSFVVMDDNSKVQYVSIVFSNQDSPSKTISKDLISSAILIPILLLFCIILGISIFCVRRKK